MHLNVLYAHLQQTQHTDFEALPVFSNICSRRVRLRAAANVQKPFVMERPSFRFHLYKIPAGLIAIIRIMKSLTEPIRPDAVIKILDQVTQYTLKFPLDRIIQGDTQSDQFFSFHTISLHLGIKRAH